MYAAIINTEAIHQTKRHIAFVNQFALQIEVEIDPTDNLSIGIQNGESNRMRVHRIQGESTLPESDFHMLQTAELDRHSVGEINDRQFTHLLAVPA